MLYNELTEEQKEKVIDGFNNDADYWQLVTEMLNEDIEMEFEQVCEDSSNFEFNYSYMSGSDDGFIFTGTIDYTNIDKFPFANLVKDKDSILIDISRSRNSMHCEIDVDVDRDYSGVADLYSDEEYDKLVDSVGQWYDNICDTMFEYVKSYVDGCFEREYIEELIEANQYEFDENGNWI